VEGLQKKVYSLYVHTGALAAIALIPACVGSLDCAFAPNPVEVREFTCRALSEIRFLYPVFRDWGSWGSWKVPGGV